MIRRSNARSRSAAPGPGVDPSFVGPGRNGSGQMGPRGGRLGAVCIKQRRAGLVGRIALLIALVGATACGPRLTELKTVAESTRRAEVALYKVRVKGPNAPSRGFRMQIFAEAPDRMHAEAISPVGGTLMIIDGGQGQLTVSWIKERRSYVGPATPDALEHLFGFPLQLEDWVGAFLGTGPVPDPIQATREGETHRSPDRWILKTDTRRLEMTLKRRTEIESLNTEVGTGTPPKGFEIRPLSELVGEPLPDGFSSGSVDP